MSIVTPNPSSGPSNGARNDRREVQRVQILAEEPLFLGDFTDIDEIRGVFPGAAEHMVPFEVLQPELERSVAVHVALCEGEPESQVDTAGQRDADRRTGDVTITHIDLPREVLFTSLHGAGHDDIRAETQAVGSTLADNAGGAALGLGEFDRPVTRARVPEVAVHGDDGNVARGSIDPFGCQPTVSGSCTSVLNSFDKSSQKM